MQQLLSPSELATYLGMATQTIYNRISLGESLPPRLLIGRLIRFPMAGIEMWLLEQAENPSPIATESAAPVQPRHRGRPTKAEQIARRKEISHQPLKSNHTTQPINHK